MDWRRYAPLTLRIGLSAVFLWFGVNQFVRPDYFLGYLPGWEFPVSATTVVVLNGVLDTTLGVLLLLGLFTRVAAAIATAHLLSIAVSLGYNDIAVRDVGLAIVALSLVLHGPDRYSIDDYRSRRR